MADTLLNACTRTFRASLRFEPSKGVNSAVSLEKVRVRSSAQSRPLHRCQPDLYIYSEGLNQAKGMCSRDMKHVKITAFDLPDAWYQVLGKIWEDGETFAVRYGSEATETRKLDVTIEIVHPENRPLVHEKAPCDMKYVTSYFMEYLWFGEKKPDETYTYSSRLRDPVDQIENAIARYVDELFDRQITLVIRKPEDIFKELKGRSHEPPCLTILDTEVIRDEADKKLWFNLFGYFRSWDAYAALPANLAGLQLFSEEFVKQLNLKGTTKHGKSWKRVKPGRMIMQSKNCHVYQRQYSLVDELLKVKRPSFGERIQVPKKTETNPPNMQ